MSKIFDEIRQDTPKHIDIFVEKSMNLSARIWDLIDENPAHKAAIAKALNIEEDAVEDAVSGFVNFNLEEIAKIEAALGTSFFTISYPVSEAKAFEGDMASRIREAFSKAHEQSKKSIYFGNIEVNITEEKNIAVFQSIEYPMKHKSQKFTYRTV